MPGITRKVTFEVTSNGCHRCTSHSECRGRPRCMEDGKIKLISRLLWERKYGYYLPREVVLRHTCDNPWCINLDHLITGTQANNIQDAVSRNRMAKGERAGNAFLKSDEIHAIRKLYNEGNLSQREIAKLFSTTQSNVSVIVRKKNWAHL